MTLQHPSRFDPAKKYVQVLQPAGERHGHSHDLNDMGAMMHARIKAVTDVVLRDGGVVDGAAMVVNRQTGVTTVAAGRVYADGIIHDVPERRNFVIPVDRRVRIGICVVERIVTYLDDPDLKGQIPGTRAYGEPGADRLRVTATWTWEGEGTCEGRFYGVYDSDEGEVVTPDPPSDPLDDRLARYDREANGHYIVSGWRVTPLGYTADNDSQTYSIGEGVINIWGYKRDRTTSYRLRVVEAAERLVVEAEPHLVPAGASGDVAILTNHGPIHTLRSVTVLRQRTAQITHGAYSGVQDPLPHQSVAAIIAITQGGTTYIQGTDYVLAADHVDWRAITANEPAPGSTYTVTYQFLDAGPPDAWNETGITVSDVVAGSTVIIAYEWALPRIDAIAVDRDGHIHYVRGTSAPYTPIPPRVPLDMMAIAWITNRWRAMPSVRNVGTRAVHNTVLELRGDLLQDLYDLVAQERLRRDMDSRQTTTKRGVFVDPLHDDDMRDQGLAQTAAIVNQSLMLPIAARVETRRIDREPQSLDWNEVPWIEQLLSTSSMLVNPYGSFAPLPARLHLDPAIDTWTETRTNWTSETTRTVVTRGSGNQRIRGVVIDSVTTTVENGGSEITDAELLRQIDVLFDIDGFGAGELLASVTFDGLPVTPRPDPATNVPLVADAQGRLAGVFTVPANIPAGAKRVVMTGAGGTRASGTFVGAGTITVQTLRLVTNTQTTDFLVDDFVDPLAQTFTSPLQRDLAAVDLKFTAVGDRGNPCLLQVRETNLGLPTRRVLAEATIPMNAVVAGEWTHVALPAPVPMLRGVEYAIVILSDDNAHALATAGVGDFDAENQRYVTAQPYQIGVLLSSSNASTWTPHNNADLTFRLYSAAYTETERALPLPQTVELIDCTDLVVAVGVDEPTTAARAEVRITRASGEVVWTRPGQRVVFPVAVTETVSIAIVARGTGTESPIVYPWVQIIQGTIQPTGTYISRAMPAGNATSPMNVVVTFDALFPGASNVVVEAGRDGDWTAMPLHSATPLGDGWVERSYVLTDYVLTDARIRLTLSGSSAARPEIRQIRANVTADPVNIITGQ